MPFVIIPLKSLAAVRKANPDRKKIRSILKTNSTRELLVFSRQTYLPENDLNLRVFLDIDRIAEDPATGSASGCLGAYLLKYRYFEKTKLVLRLEQGYEIDRPSLVLFKAEIRSGAYRIATGKKVIPVVCGTLTLSDDAELAVNLH